MTAKGKLRKLTAVKVKRVDLVDAGDNPAADVMLYKRKEDGMTCPSCGASAPEGAKTCPKCGKAMGGAKLMKYASDPKTVGEVLASREALDDLWKLQSAFNTSLDSIMCSELEPAARATALTKSLEEFLAALKVLVAAYAAAVDVPAPEQVTAETVSDMAKRAAEEVTRVVKEASMSTPKDPKAQPAAFDLAAIPEALRPQVEAFQKRAADAEKAATDLAAAVALTGTLQAEVAELKKKLEPPAAPVDDPKVVELRKKVADLEDERDLGRFEKRAKDLGVIPGTTPEKLAPVLKRLDQGKSTPEDCREIERLLKTSSELARQSEAFKKLGHDGDSTDTGSETGNAAYEIAKRKAAELVTKGEAKTPEAALQEVWKRHPDLWERYRAAN